MSSLSAAVVDSWVRFSIPSRLRILLTVDLAIEYLPASDFVDSPDV